MGTISKLLKKITNKSKWALEDFLWLMMKSIYGYLNPNSVNQFFTIGIATFMDRYKSCLKPLIKKITALFPNCQIIVIANGHVKKIQQQEYLKKIKDFCSDFSNVQLIFYGDPKGLSYLWNQIILNSKYEKILILNDDIKIKISFPLFMNNSGILNQEIATINSSWSHFLISKKTFIKVGYFDEAYKEIGGEDDDYAARLAIAGIPVQNFNTETITAKFRRKNRLLKINSYGKDMSKEKSGYSTLNSEYLDKKWQTSMEYFEGAVKVPNRRMRYWKIRN